MKASRATGAMMACLALAIAGAVTEIWALTHGARPSALTVTMFAADIIALAAMNIRLGRQLRRRYSTLERWGTALGRRQAMLDRREAHISQREESLKWWEGTLR